MRLAINPDGCFSIGVNIDRDHVTVVALDFLGNVRARAAEDVSRLFADVLPQPVLSKTMRLPRPSVNCSSVMA